MWRSKSRTKPIEQFIPARVVVGLTGHRSLETSPALTSVIHSAIEMIRSMVSSWPRAPLVRSILSPLSSLDFIRGVRVE
jgi:hypothetical protein